MGHHIYVIILCGGVSFLKDVNRLEKIIKTLQNNNVEYEIYTNCNYYTVLLNFIDKHEISSDDILWIYFTGHGKILGKRINGNVKMISTWIYNNSNNDECYVYSYKIDSLLTGVDANIVLMSDSCHSGGFTNFYTGSSPLIFVGSSSIIHTSINVSDGILVNLLESYIIPNVSSYMKYEVIGCGIFMNIFMKEFSDALNIYSKKNNILSKPIIKYYNIIQNEFTLNKVI